MDGSPEKNTQQRKAGDFGHDSGHGRTNCGHGEISYSSIKNNSEASGQGNCISSVGYNPGAAGKEALITAVHESHGEVSAATGQGGFDLSSACGLCYGNFGGGGIGNGAHSGRPAGGQV